MHTVLKLLMNWQKCYHTTLEKKFEVDSPDKKNGLWQILFACNGDVKKAPDCFISNS